MIEAHQVKWTPFPLAITEFPDVKKQQPHRIVPSPKSPHAPVQPPPHRSAFDLFYL